MAEFEAAYQRLLEHEGGFVNDKDDSGGATKYGISLRFLKDIHEDINLDGVIDIQDIRDLTLDKTKELYKIHFWSPYLLGGLCSQRLATMVFGMVVNMGPSQALKLLARALNVMLTKNKKKKLEETGRMDKEFLALINRYNRHESVIGLYKTRVIEFYNYLAQKDIKKKKFLFGWVTRAESY